jgi:hypothetical protein
LIYCFAIKNYRNSLRKMGAFQSAACLDVTQGLSLTMTKLASAAVAWRLAKDACESGDQQFNDRPVAPISQSQL